MQRSLPLPVLALTALGCSGSTTAKEPVAAPPAADSALASTSAEPAPETAPTEGTDHEGPLDTLPDKCAEGNAEGICAPPRSFVKRLCGRYPLTEIALKMFTKEAPWTHVYMNRNMEAWYTSGQQSTSSKLLFDEELIVLAHPKASTTGMVIGNGATPYDVLRLDGVCASVESEAITAKRPPAPKHATIPWQRLDRNVRDALSADPDIAKADAARRKECKGTTGFGVITPACAKADDKLSQAVAEYIARGGQTPMPSK